MTDRDDNWQQLQEQEEEQQYIKERNALSDAEFYSWIASIEKEVSGGDLQSTKAPF